MQKHDIDRFYRKVMTCIKAGGGSSCNVVVARQTGRQPRLVALPHQLIKRSIRIAAQGLKVSPRRTDCMPAFGGFRGGESIAVSVNQTFVFTYAK